MQAGTHKIKTMLFNNTISYSQWWVEIYSGLFIIPCVMIHIAGCYHSNSLLYLKIVSIFHLGESDVRFPGQCWRGRGIPGCVLRVLRHWGRGREQRELWDKRTLVLTQWTVSGYNNTCTWKFRQFCHLPWMAKIYVYHANFLSYV